MNPRERLSLSGEAKFGATLEVTTPTFEVSGVEVKYTWSWDSGGVETDEPSLVVPWSAVGKRITVFVDWSKEGYADNSRRFDTDQISFSGGVLRSGIVEGDQYVLSPAQNSYLITEPIQIPQGVTLVVMPGVEMRSANRNLKVFWVNGELDIRGTRDAPVRVSGPFGALFWTWAASSSIEPVISVETLEVDGKGNGAILPPTGNGGRVELSIWGSKFINLPDYSYLWYPNLVWIIENEFVNAGGFSVGTNSRYVTFEGNVFRGNKWNAGLNGTIFSFWAQYGGDNYIKVKGNIFEDSVPLVAASELDSDQSVDLSLNFWGDRNDNQIRNSILDQTYSLDFGGSIDSIPSLSNVEGIGEGRGLAFGSISVPEITPSSEVAEGMTLSVSVDTWSPSPDSMSFQWKRNGAPISGANGSQYSLSSNDVGNVISVSVTGDKFGYVLSTIDSRNTSIVSSALSFASASSPVIVGSPVEGQVLRASFSEWAPTPTSYSWQWLRNGSPITGETSDTYQLREQDVGSRISVQLSALKEGYALTLRVSSQTGVVQEIPFTNKTFAGYGQARCIGAAGKPAPVVMDYGAYWTDTPYAINSGYVPNLSLSSSVGNSYSGVLYWGVPSRLEALWYYYAEPSLSGTTVQANSGRQYYTYSSTGRYLFGSYRYNYQFAESWSARVWITCRGQF